MPRGRKKKRREALNRFADTGRLVLVSGATLLPMRAHSNRARVSAGACLLSIKFLSKGLKKAVPEERPNGEDDKSFPSEHSAQCVAAAMLLEREYGGIVGALAFGLASSVCMARIQSKKHHPRDVAAGALIAVGSVWLSLRLRLAIERRMLAAGHPA